MALPLFDQYHEWQAPPADSRESRKLGWLNEAVEEGQHFIRAQRGTLDWTRALDIVAGRYSPKDVLEYRSDLTSNRLKTNIEVFVAGLAAIRPWGGYDSTEPFRPIARMMNEVTRALYLEGFWDLDLKSGLQWYALTGSGFIHPVYRRDMAGQGHGHIELDTFGVPSVLPLQLPANGNYQRAYAVTLLDERPIYEAHGMFWQHQDKLRPTSSRYWYASEIRQATESNAERRRWFDPFRRQSQSRERNLLIPIRYTTINDLSLNTTGTTLSMGEPGSSWSYEVPSYGAEIPDGKGGVRKATEHDARIYPFRRLMISSEACVMYDGPSFNWHGELDLIQMALDRWPFEPNGFGMVHDGWRMQRALDQLDRGCMDKIMADMDRPLAYNLNAVTKREAMQVDLMQPRQRIAFDGDVVDKPFTEIAPPDVYRVSPETLNMRQQLKDDLDYLYQTRDIVELGKARALGKGMDQIEALIAANGPLVKDKSRIMEKSITQIANQVKFLVLQFMDTGRLIPYIGEDGRSLIFDYDPSSLVPSHLPGEDVVDMNQNPLSSPTSRINRARWMAWRMPHALTAHSLHEIHQLTYRLVLMQLRQRGYQIAECDVLEANDIPDVFRTPGATTQERFRNEKKEQMEFMAEMQKVAEGAGIDLGSVMGMQGGAKPPGRPASGQKTPEMKQKGDGRPTVTES